MTFCKGIKHTLQRPCSWAIISVLSAGEIIVRMNQNITDIGGAFFTVYRISLISFQFGVTILNYPTAQSNPYWPFS